VGCNSAAADGNWNSSWQRAAENFNRHSGLKIAANGASADAIDSVKSKTSRVCPLICETGFRAEGERCVAIVCPPGEKAGDDGKCQKPARKTAAKSRPEREDRPAAAAPSPQQIACTRSGCIEVKSGCRATRGGTYQRIICN
jgi:hypothetical protein